MWIESALMASALAAITMSAIVFPYGVYVEFPCDDDPLFMRISHALASVVLIAACVSFWGFALTSQYSPFVQ